MNWKTGFPSAPCPIGVLRTHFFHFFPLTIRQKPSPTKKPLLVKLLRAKAFKMLLGTDFFLGNFRGRLISFSSPLPYQLGLTLQHAVSLSNRRPQLYPFFTSQVRGHIVPKFIEGTTQNQVLFQSFYMLFMRSRIKILGKFMEGRDENDHSKNKVQSRSQCSF